MIVGSGFFVVVVVVGRLFKEPTSSFQISRDGIWHECTVLQLDTHRFLELNFWYDVILSRYGLGYISLELL